MSRKKRSLSDRKTAERFGEVLRSLRMDRGWEQKDVGAEIGVVGDTISKWERGVREPDSIYQLIRLADLFSVSLDRLLTGNDKRLPMMRAAVLSDTTVEYGGPERRHDESQKTYSGPLWRRSTDETRR